MLSINTNISSQIVQQSMANATKLLNLSIEQMTTGSKLNHAKDNAANFNIVTNLNTHINSLLVAEDNAAMALDLLDVTSSNLDLVTSHFQRLLDLATLSSNNSFNYETLQKETNARLEEVGKIMNNTEYNGLKLFNETAVQSGSGTTTTVEAFADRDTTFDELGINNYEFTTYDKNGNPTQNYTLDSLDSIGKFLDILNNSGYHAQITNGTISLNSSDGSYVTGSLIDELGITTSTKETVTNSTMSSTQAITYTEVILANSGTSFAQVGLDVANKTLEVRTKDGNNLVGNITLNNSQTFDDLFTELSSLGVTGSINNGKITLNSTSNYITGDIATLLGIQTIASSDVFTVGITMTSTAPVTYTDITTASVENTLADLGIGNTSVIIENTSGTALNTIDISSTTTLENLFTTLANNSVSVSMTEGIISVNGKNTITGALADSLGIEKDTTSEKFGITYTTDAVVVERSITVSVTQTSTIAMPASGTLINPFTYIDASSCMDVADSSVTSLLANTTYKITNTEGLIKLASMDYASVSNDATIVLMDNIDLSTSGDWKPFRFGSTFEGNGYAISNMTIVNEDGYGYEELDTGFFSYLSGTVKNLKILDASITDNFGENTGILAGYSKNAIIENCTISGSIDSSSLTEVGGLIGETFGTISIQYCYVDVDNKSDSNTIGGLVGYLNADNVVINGCYITGSITSSSLPGGGLIDSVSDNGFGNDKLTITNNNVAVSGDCHSFIGDLSANGSFIINNNTCLSSGTAPIGNSIDNVVSDHYAPLYYHSDGLMKKFSICTPNYITIVNNGTVQTITVNPDDTVDSMISALNNAGISAALTESGWSISGDSTAFILDISPELKEKLKLNAGEGITYQSTANTIFINTDSNTLTASSAPINVETSTNLNRIGISSNETITIMQNGVENTITASSNDSIADLISKLDDNGILSSLQNGKITLSGADNAYIKSISTDLANTLNINAGENKTYTVTGKTLYSNKQSDNTFQSTTTSNANNTTKLSTIAGYSHGNGNVCIHKDDASSITLNFNDANTLQDFFNTIKYYGINGSISNGIITLSSNNDTYVNSITGGSNILSSLKMGTLQQNKENKTYNNDSNRLIYTKYLEADWKNYSFNTTFGVIGGNIKDTCTIDYNFDLNFGINLSTPDSSKAAISDINKMLNQISQTQTTLASLQNTFLSVVDEISIKYENMVSSRSTLQDADIADLSSEYIRDKILQEASATLLATANQSASIALGLL